MSIKINFTTLNGNRKNNKLQYKENIPLNAIFCFCFPFYMYLSPFWTHKKLIENEIVQIFISTDINPLINSLLFIRISCSRIPKKVKRNNCWATFSRRGYTNQTYSKLNLLLYWNTIYIGSIYDKLLLSTLCVISMATNLKFL